MLRERRRAAVVLPSLPAALMLGVLFLLAAPASAHAMLEGSTPAADSVVHVAPSSVDLVFSEAITLLPDSVRVFASDGGQVDDGHVAHAHADPATASVGLRSGLAAGTYLVSYRVVSADSHPISGAYTFSIGHPSRAPAVALASSGGSRSVDVTLGLARWLSYAGSALGLGGVVFLAWCWPAGWRSSRARRWVGGGVGLLAVGTALALLLKGPYDAGLGLAHATDGDLLREVLATTYGRGLDARLLLVAVAILVLTYRERLPDRLVAWGSVALLAATGVTFALGGHAAAGHDRALAILSDTVHVMAMSAWLGGLWLLTAVLLPGRLDHDRVAVPVRRFSTVATASVTLLVATGTFQALREVRSWDVLLHTHYGHVLLVKLLVVCLALAAASGSRAWVWQSRHPVVPVHAMTAAATKPVAAGGPAVARLRVTVGIESLVLLGVLVASALLVTSDPARSTVAPTSVATTLTVGPDTVRVSAAPAGVHVIALRLQVLDAHKRPVEPAEVDAALSLATQQVGPLPVDLTSGGHGLRTGRATLPLSGTWRLAVTVRTSPIDEATAYVDVPVS